MKKAWIVDGRIQDIAWTNPNEIFHSSIAVLYDTDVPDDAKPGMKLIDGVWQFEVVEPPVQNPP